MAVKTVRLKRTFQYKGRDLPDPDPSKTPAQVMGLYANQFPELANGEIKPTTSPAGEKVYAFASNTGVKG